MYTDISKFTLSPMQDNLSQFFTSLTITVTGAGTWAQKEVSKIHDFMITDYEILYLLKGSTHMTYQGIGFDCNEGDAILIEPFQLYSAACTSSEKVQYMYLHFSVEPYMVRQELIEMLRGTGMPLYSGESFRSFYRMFWGLCTPEEQALEGHALMLKFALIRILLAMVRQRKDLAVKFERLVHSSVETEHIQRAVDYVMAHMDDPIKVSQVAAKIGTSENKMYKSFMDLLGTPPSKYFMQIKIKHAEELLKGTDMTIEEIGFATGFSSVFHFSKSFKGMLGVSPSYLRKGRV